MRVDLDVTGDAEARRDLLARAHRLVHLKPVLDDVADDIFALENEVWETAGAAIGVRWPALSPRWAAWKARNRPGAGLLEMTAGGGPLRRSLTERGAPYQVFDVGDTKLVVGTRFGIARVHQRGGIVRRRAGGQAKVPKRQMLKARKVDRARWVGAIHGYVDAGQSGGRLVKL